MKASEIESSQPRRGMTQAGSITLIATAGSYLIAIATGVIVARALGPEARGLYGTATTLTILVVGATEFGIGYSAIYFLAQDRYPARAVVGSSLTLALIIGLVAGIAGVLAAAAF